MKKWLVIIVCVVALALAALYRVHRIRATPVVQSIEAMQAEAGFPVRTYTVQPRHLRRTVAVSGGVEAYQSVAIAPKVSDRIAAIHVRTGQRVASGELLVTLETRTAKLRLAQAEAHLAQAQSELEKLRNGTRPEDLNAAEATLREAAARARLMETEYQRQQALFAENATTLQRVQQAENEYNMSTAGASRAQAQYDLAVAGARAEDIAMAEAAVRLAEVAVEQAQQYLDDHYLHAPAAGVVTANELEVGDIAEIFMPIFNVLAIDQVHLVLDISEIYMPLVAPGLAVDVSIDARPGNAFTGKIDEINPSAGVNNRAYRTKILIANPEYKLLPGMFGRAHIVTAEKSDALTVPDDALRYDEQGDFVWAVSADDTLRRVGVTLGESFGDFLHVADGLAPGMRVVTLAPTDLQAGQQVTVANDQ